MNRRDLWHAGLAFFVATAMTACSLPGSSTQSPPLPAASTVAVPSALPYRETWSNPGTGWEIGTFDTGILRYGQKYYSVTSLQKGQLMWGLAYKRFSNIAVEVDATQVAAPEDNNNAYGVMCRVQPNDDGYLLRVSGDGQVAITRILDGKFEDLVAWAASDAVRQGDDINHLLVVCDGSRLSLTVNGRLVAQTDDTAFSSGDIALTATTFTDTPTEIHYENLIATAP